MAETLRMDREQLTAALAEALERTSFAYSPGRAKMLGDGNASVKPLVTNEYAEGIIAGMEAEHPGMFGEAAGLRVTPDSLAAALEKVPAVVSGAGLFASTGSEFHSVTRTVRSPETFAELLLAEIGKTTDAGDKPEPVLCQYHGGEFGPCIPDCDKYTDDDDNGSGDLPKIHTGNAASAARTRIRAALSWVPPQHREELLRDIAAEYAAGDGGGDEAAGSPFFSREIDVLNQVSALLGSVPEGKARTILHFVAEEHDADLQF